MRHIIRKAYYNFEKEEKWLNEMSAKGMALIDYSWCRYVFEDTEEGEYIYRIELLEKWASNPESKAYIRFLEENGVECVATYMRWVFLRRKASEGPFDIYSDIESQIKHYKKVYRLWCVLAGFEYAIAIFDISIGITHMLNGLNNVMYNFIGGFVLLLIGIMFTNLAIPLRKKIKKLQLEKIILE